MPRQIATPSFRLVADGVVQHIDSDDLVKIRTVAEDGSLSESLDTNSLDQYQHRVLQSLSAFTSDNADIIHVQRSLELLEYLGKHKQFDRVYQAVVPHLLNILGENRSKVDTDFGCPHYQLVELKTMVLNLFLHLHNATRGTLLMNSGLLPRLLQIIRSRTSSDDVEVVHLSIEILSRSFSCEHSGMPCSTCVSVLEEMNQIALERNTPESCIKHIVAVISRVLKKAEAILPYLKQSKTTSNTMFWLLQHPDRSILCQTLIAYCNLFCLSSEDSLFFLDYLPILEEMKRIVQLHTYRDVANHNVLRDVWWVVSNLGANTEEIVDRLFDLDFFPSLCIDGLKFANNMILYEVIYTLNTLSVSYNRVIQLFTSDLEFIDTILSLGSQGTRIDERTSQELSVLVNRILELVQSPKALAPSTRPGSSRRIIMWKYNHPEHVNSLILLQKILESKVSNPITTN